jgi:hypothetical protein
MQHYALRIGMLPLVCGLVANAATALAANETWVAATGADTGICAITAPCRTFAYAHSQSSNNGSINVLTSGNFGPLTINKPISIVAEGVEAVIDTGANGAGIIVQAGGGVISLRGLTIDLRGTDNIGISFVSGTVLHVHDSVIRKASYGIRFAPVSGISKLIVADSLIADANVDGINVAPSGNGGARVVLDHTRVENSLGTGMLFSGDSTTGSIRATVRDSAATGNGASFGSGIAATESGSGTVSLMIDRTAVVNSNTGVLAFGAGATIRIGDSTVTGSSTGLSSGSGGVIASYGTNQVDGNGADGAPTSTISMK